jgi:ESS family glutamate:Na+ symporter
VTLACVLVAVWLLCGAGLRSRFAVFDRIYIPPSVIAGFIGLLVMQLSSRRDLPGAESVGDAAESLKAWPGTLIAVVFAGMLLPRATLPWRQSVRAAGREALMVWIIVLGQTAIGLMATWLIIQPFYDLPASFGMLIETGFAGGHGTAAAMGQVFASPQVNLPEGKDLGLLMATIGLVYGTLSGILWINLASRVGWVTRQASEATEATLTSTESEMRELQQKSFARGIDPMLVQAIWLALAFGIGLAIQSAVGFAAYEIDDSLRAAQLATVSSDETVRADLVKDKVSFTAVLGSFPLFIYTLIGGWIIRKAVKACGLGLLIDEVSVSRWTSMAMDLLVVAAIATLNIAAVIELAVPFFVLVGCGMIWTAVCLLVISRRILPERHWFQLGLINYGMSTGVTATGFILLRIVDPELKTDAAKEYAIAAPLSAPFIGGGMFTIGLPLLVLEQVPIYASALTISFVVMALIAIGWSRRPNNNGVSVQHPPKAP